jgi:4-amino-4-deoxy-L-arabinose transferase-like glycosyltransferase
VSLAAPDQLEHMGDQPQPRAAETSAPPRAVPALSDPAWSLPCLAAVAGLAAVLMVWCLARNGYANTYYSSAVYAASRSWSAFGFGALDLSGFVSVDKTPLSIWMMALSARLFGFGPLSMLLPNAICGVASVLVLHNVVKRSLGPRVAIVAALVLAISPVMVVVSRFNNPDALLVLLLICAAWAATRALEFGRTRDLVLCGVLLGLAFNTKMLQAYLVVPGLALAFFAAAPGPPRRRLAQLEIAGAVMFAVSFAWVAAVTLVPAAHRPWVGDTTTNSWWQLIFGANGVARVTAGVTASSPGGSLGILRLFNPQNGGQIAWLMPLAGLGLVSGLWLTRGAHRRDPRRAAFLLWGVWAVVHFVLFSLVINLFHPYYTSALAPAVAVLAASALVMFWDRLSSSRAIAAIAAATLLGSVGLAVVLLQRTRFLPWLPWMLAALAVGAAGGGLALTRISSSRRLLRGAVAVVGLTSLLAGPGAFAMATVERRLGGVDPTGGPAALASSASQGRAAGEVALEGYLAAHRGKTKYLVAVGGSAVAAPLILSTRQPVITMGGFAGTDPAPTATQLRELVMTMKVRFVLIPDGATAAGESSAAVGLGGDRARATWVATNCTALRLAPVITTSQGATRERLWDCAPS